jgi:hypothetical protein
MSRAPSFEDQLLQIAGCLDETTKISLNTLSQGETTIDVQCADVRSTSGANAWPLMVLTKFARQSAIKVFSFADVNSVPPAIGRKFAEDINARPLEVDSSNRVQLKLV